MSLLDDLERERRRKKEITDRKQWKEFKKRCPLNTPVVHVDFKTKRKLP